MEKIECWLKDKTSPVTVWPGISSDGHSYRVYMEAAWRTRSEVRKGTLTSRMVFCQSPESQGTTVWLEDAPALCSVHSRKTSAQILRVCKQWLTVREGALGISFSKTSEHCQPFMLCFMQLKPLLFRPTANPCVREKAFQNHYHLPR